MSDDPTMPLFVLKAKDTLATETVAAYRELCVQRGLHEQAHEVDRALAEIIEWRLRHADQVKDPDHKHVPHRRA